MVPGTGQAAPGHGPLKTRQRLVPLFQVYDDMRRLEQPSFP
jgi:hypothetical protein